MPPPITKPALLLHLLTETPAALSFLFAPTAQLPGASPDAKLILRNLGGLLMATNLVSLVVLFTTRPEEEDDKLTAMICVCLGTYHVWPLYRAWARMMRSGRPGQGQEKKVLGGPVVHFGVHLLCLGALVGGGVVALLGY
ncbi:hypothetical protein C8A00DRAFT_28626 [Chaetomidium leptoderma]|uniref:Uncharacterized protein n=1 Tax=Chaetomidium leptoderma TaxID=669021 RepID=A0AAN7A2U4_9PEZI|nr:hypothetical protein C8A00DRAFT_28626 [Chaetomidium leptoderma]